MIQVEQHGPVTTIRMARAFLGRPLEWTAAYFVDGLLIDAGPRCTADELVRVLEKVSVRAVMITHAHEDQFGGVSAVCRRYPEATVYAARSAIPVLNEPARLGLPLYRRLIWGMPPPVADVRPLDEVGDRVITPGYEFRAIETPGHCRSHIALFEPTYRWLFSGDTYLGGRECVWNDEVDMFALIGSLRVLAGLRPERLFPGSGYVRRTPQPDIHDKISYYLNLCRQVGRLTSAGFDFEAIRAQIVSREPAIHRWSFGHYSSANLIRSCIDYNLLVQPAIHGVPAGMPPGDRPVSDSLPDRSN